MTVRWHLCPAVLLAFVCVLAGCRSKSQEVVGRESVRGAQTSAQPGAKDRVPPCTERDPTSPLYLAEWKPLRPTHLRDLTAARVVIERLHEDATMVGVSEDALRRATADHLRGMGLKVVDTPVNVPWVYVDVRAWKAADLKACEYYVALEVHRDVTITDLGCSCKAPVWDAWSVDDAPCDRTASAVMESLNERLALFESHWRKANPKE